MEITEKKKKVWKVEWYVERGLRGHVGKITCDNEEKAAMVASKAYVKGWDVKIYEINGITILKH